MSRTASEDVKRLLLSSSTNKEALLSQAINSVCRPVLANLMRDSENQRFGTLRCANAKIATALAIPGVLEWFKLGGFVEETKKKTIESAPPATGGGEAREEEEVFLFWKGSRANLQAANSTLSEVEDAIEEGKQSRLQGGHQASLRSQRAEQEKDEAKNRVREQLERDRKAVENLQAQRLAEERQHVLEQACFDEVKHLEEVAKKTLHYHGRIRNASYNAEHFTLRRMTHGRAHVCTQCPNDFIEAHWHVRNAALLYSYVVHLNADATEVIHQGPEDGYQYNSLPGTPHFGKTLYISSKMVEEGTGKVKCETPNTTVEFCRHCMVSFRKLAV